MTGLSLSGADAANYTVNTTAWTVANILASAAIVDRRIFYNGSNFFGTGGANNNPTVNPIAAIDTTKSALLPGQTTTSTHYSNYSLGLNGLVIDISGASNLSNISAASFPIRHVELLS